MLYRRRTTDSGSSTRIVISGAHRALHMTVDVLLALAFIGVLAQNVVLLRQNHELKSPPPPCSATTQPIGRAGY